MLSTITQTDTLKLGLRRILEQEISKIVLQNCNILLWTDAHRKLLSFCLKQGFLDRPWLNVEVTKLLKREGRANYEAHLRNDAAVDHDLRSPHALVFAMRRGELTNEEVGRIRFDHGDNQYTFMKGAEDRLIISVIDQILPPG